MRDLAPHVTEAYAKADAEIAARPIKTEPLPIREETVAPPEPMKLTPETVPTPPEAGVVDAEAAKVEGEHQSHEAQEGGPSPTRDYQRRLGDGKDGEHALEVSLNAEESSPPADAGLPALPRLG
jgi:hypothetical protein